MESSTETTNNAPIQYIQNGEAEGGGEGGEQYKDDDVKDYSMYILIVVVVLFIIGLAVVFR